MPDNDENKKITETLYEHNVELAVKNKTLALLENLYQKSISILTPEAMAREICDTVRQDINLEFSGILIFRKKADTLAPLAFSKSDRLTKTLGDLGFLFSDIKITDVSKKDFLKKVAYDKQNGMTNNLEEIWGELIKKEDLVKIKEESNIKTVLLYPLLAGEDVKEVLILGLNREYETLNTFEKSSITSFINVIAVSLGKAYLYKDLQDANSSLQNIIKQRESLVHLVTHKVKGSFTRSKYIFAGIVDGTFGEVSEEVKKYAAQGLESDNMGIETVDLVLNADNLQKGAVKYDIKKINFKDIVLKTIEEKKIQTEAHGLKIETDIKEDEKNPDYNVMGDSFWLKEAINNLIENAVKYTKKGEIKIGLSDGDGKVRFYVKDSGVGITDEDKKLLFTEGGRGKNSVKVNVDSTGYGLYSVKLIMDAHQGRTWAESEGPEKGSTFYIEIDSVK
jgi:signal transduction histidine kinase